MTGAALVLCLLVSLPFLYVLVRRPVLRRMALRNAVRRPREAALVVIGSMLGAAIITGSFVVGDAMNASIRQVAHEHLGPVDELVLARDQSTWEQLSSQLAHLPRTRVDGVLPIATMDAGVSSYRPGHVTAAPNARVIGVDFVGARRFGGDAGATGMRGTEPEEGHAAITIDLAKTLNVRVGDIIDVNAYGTRSMLFVDRILPRRGIAGFNTSQLQESRNVIVSPSQFDGIRGTASPFAAPPTWSVLVSNRGGVESGVDGSKTVNSEIRRIAAGLDPQVVDIKRLVLDQADATGKAFTQMFSTMGSFGVIAGLLLLVQLFVMLAAERKPELGMARAVGMRRSWLVGGFATEGWLYAVIATVLGTGVGIGLGRLLVGVSAAAFNTEHNQFRFMFVLRSASLAEAFAIAFVIALLTIVITSARVSRLNIIRAIRDIPEPPPRRRRRWLVVGAVASGLGAAWTLSATAADEPVGLILGPTLLFFGLTPWAARLRRSRGAISLLASATVGWTAVALALFPNAAEGAPVTIYVVQGIVLVGSAVVLVALQQERIGATVKRANPHSLAYRLGLAYPLARRSRTGLTVAMYALVVFILAFITTISHMIDAHAAREKESVRGGYDVVVSSSAANPISRTELAAYPGIRSVAPLESATANYTVPGMSKPAPWNLTAFDEPFIAGGPPKLEDRGSYASDTEAWRAVMTNPKLVIVDPAFLQNEGGPPNFKAEIGTKIRIENPTTGETRIAAVAAIAPSDMFIANGAFYGLHGAHRLFGERLVPSRFYVKLRPGADAVAIASALQGHFLDNGTAADSIDELMDEAFRMTTQVFQLFEGYLALGLLVGIAGIAVVMIRAVRERRRPIGTLRAIGYSSRVVGRSFAVETAFIAIEGTVIGASLALLTLWTLVTNSDAMGDVNFSVPWLPLLGLLVGTVAASLLATVAPAISASRIRPAVALRTTD